MSDRGNENILKAWWGRLHVGAWVLVRHRIANPDGMVQTSRATIIAVKPTTYEVVLDSPVGKRSREVSHKEVVPFNPEHEVGPPGATPTSSTEDET